MFDYTICIAVIHHLSTVEKRKKAISELLRITKSNGEILILVWALEQETDSRRKFIKQDNYVDWKDKKQNLLGKRYYYVFKQNELESLIDDKNIIINCHCSIRFKNGTYKNLINTVNAAILGNIAKNVVTDVGDPS